MRVVWLLALALLLSGCSGSGPGPEQGGGDGTTNDIVVDGSAPGGTGSAAASAQGGTTSGSSPAGSGAAAAAATVPPSGHATFRLNGHWEQEAAAFVAGSSRWQDDLLLFPVARGAQAILVELAWNDTTQDLDPHLAGGADCFAVEENPAASCAEYAVGDGSAGKWWNRGGGTGAGDSVARIEVQGERLGMYTCDNCPWNATVWSRDVNRDVDWFLFATVFYDGPAPQGFTAVPWSRP